MISILLNGETRLVRSHNLKHLVAELELSGKRIAIELNREIVSHSAYESTSLRESDQVEIVHAIGGG